MNGRGPGRSCGGEPPQLTRTRQVQRLGAAGPTWIRMIWYSRGGAVLLEVGVSYRMCFGSMKGPGPGGRCHQAQPSIVRQ